MKNKKLIVILAIALILLIPIRLQLKDGGTKEYKSLTYKITKYKRLDMSVKTGFVTGWRIDIFGIKVYEKTNAESIINDAKKDGNNNIEEDIIIKVVSSLNQQIDFEIENKTSYTYNYGTPYDLEKKDNDKWQKVIPTKDCFFSEIAVLLEANSKNPESVRLSYCYENLPKGRYRIVKTFYKNIMAENSKDNNTYYITGEFNIN